MPIITRETTVSMRQSLAAKRKSVKRYTVKLLQFPRSRLGIGLKAAPAFETEKSYPPGPHRKHL